MASPVSEDDNPRPQTPDAAVPSLPDQIEMDGNVWYFPITKKKGKTIFKQKRILQVDVERKTLRNTTTSSVKWEIAVQDVLMVRKREKECIATFDTEKKTYKVEFGNAELRDAFCALVDKLKLGTPIEHLRRVSSFASAPAKLKSDSPAAYAAPIDEEPSVLVSQFTVRKLRVGNRGAGSQKRILEVDALVGCLRNISDTGAVKWHLYIKDLYGCRRSKKQPEKAVVDAAKKKYGFMFESVVERDRFLTMVEYSRTFAKEQAQTTFNFDENPTESLSIFVGSWNLGNTVPPSDLSEWIAPGYDLYAIGVQEAYYKCGDDEEDNSRRDLLDKLDRHFPLQEYAQISRAFLWEMRLFVYCHRKHLGKITNVSKGSEATGLAHICGNKGGLAVKLQILETSICFISSHLAAFQEGVENRNHNFSEIIEGLHLSEDGVDVTERCHYVLWFGDLNYRIDIPREPVCEMIRQKKWTTLAEADQLKVQQQQGQCFAGFTEGPLLFPPTYRYLRHKFPREYDDEKNRIPAWCDRVLWKTWPGCKLDLQYFVSVDSITTSDHSPVHALFNCEILRPPRSQQAGRRSALPPTRYEISFRDLRLHLQGCSHSHEPQASDSETPQPQSPEVDKSHSRSPSVNAQAQSRGASALSAVRARFKNISPYFVFTSNFLTAPFQTAVAPKGLDMHWTEPVSCMVMISSKEYLRRQHLLVHLKDKSTALHESKDLAWATIELGTAADSDDCVPFNVSAYRSGYQVATIEGKLSVTELG